MAVHICTQKAAISDAQLVNAEWMPTVR